MLRHLLQVKATASRLRASGERAAQQTRSDPNNDAGFAEVHARLLRAGMYGKALGARQCRPRVMTTRCKQLTVSTAVL